MMKVLYCYYHLFYKNIWKDSNPHLATVLSLSFIISLIINGIIDLILAYIFSFYLNKYIKLGILLAIILVIHYFFNEEKGKRILKEKPVIYNHKTSITISIVFLFIGLFFHFFNADILRYILR